MRIISGKFKGIKLEGSNIDGTRPTMDRVKESLFAMINYKISESTCLDLFAGSASLGLEALSNNAKYVYFVDNSKKAIDAIKENIKKCKCEENASILNMDYKDALEKFKNENKKFDIIFLDPPYDIGILDSIINYIAKENLLNEEGLIIVEYMKDYLQNNYFDLISLRDKKYGDKNIKIYGKKGKIID